MDVFLIIWCCISSCLVRLVICVFSWFFRVAFFFFSFLIFSDFDFLLVIFVLYLLSVCIINFGVIFIVVVFFISIFCLLVFVFFVLRGLILDIILFLFFEDFEEFFLGQGFIFVIGWVYFVFILGFRVCVWKLYFGNGCFTRIVFLFFNVVLFFFIKRIQFFLSFCK